VGKWGVIWSIFLFSIIMPVQAAEIFQVNDLIKKTLKEFPINQKIKLDTATPSSPTKSSSQNFNLKEFFDPSTVSSNEIMSFLKEAAIVGINLAVLVMTVTIQVLKGLLSVMR